MQSFSANLPGLGRGWHPAWLSDRLSYADGYEAYIQWGDRFETKASWHVRKEPGPKFSIRILTPYTGVIRFEQIAWAPGRAIRLDLTLQCGGGKVGLLFNKDLVVEREEPGLAEAFRLALALPHYRILRDARLLRRASPRQPCSHLEFLYAIETFWGDPWMKNWSEFSTSNARGQKGARERFVGWQAICILAGLRSKRIATAIGVPVDDNGSDLLVRSVDPHVPDVRWIGLQICELQERFLNAEFSEDAILAFARTAKLQHYAVTDDWLMIWLRPDRPRDFDLQKLREMFHAEKRVPFKMVVILGTPPALGGKVVVASLFARDPAHHFNVAVDLDSMKFDKIQIGEDAEAIKKNHAIVLDKPARESRFDQLF